MISSVAYATEDIGSELKTGRARIFGSSVCSRWLLAFARPTKARFRTELPGRVWVAIRVEMLRRVASARTAIHR